MFHKFSFFVVQYFTLQMEYLSLKGIDIGDDGFIVMSSCLHNIHHLAIGSHRDSRVTMRGLRALSAAARNSPIGVRIPYHIT